MRAGPGKCSDGLNVQPHYTPVERWRKLSVLVRKYRGYASPSPPSPPAPMASSSNAGTPSRPSRSGRWRTPPPASRSRLALICTLSPEYVSSSQAQPRGLGCGPRLLLRQANTGGIVYPTLAGATGPSGSPGGDVGTTGAPTERREPHGFWVNQNRPERVEVTPGPVPYGRRASLPGSLAVGCEPASAFVLLVYTSPSITTSGRKFSGTWSSPTPAPNWMRTSSIKVMAVVSTASARYRPR